MASFQAKEGGKGREIVKIKIIIPISSYQTRCKEFQKNSKKFKKTAKNLKKHRYGFFSSQNRLGKPKTR